MSDRPLSPTIPRKLRRLTARLGWANGALYLLRRGLEAVSKGRIDLHCYKLVLQPVRSDPILPARWRGSVDVRRLGTGDPEIAAALSRREDLAPRLARGDACFAAFSGGRMIGYLWLCFTAFDDDETHCRFVPRPGDHGAWDYDLWVAPECRGGIVFAALWDSAWALLRQRDYGWTASRVSAFNDRSLRAHRRLGAREAGTMLVLRVGGLLASTGSVGPCLRVAGRKGDPVRVVVRAPIGPPGSGILALDRKP